MAGFGQLGGMPQIPTAAAMPQAPNPVASAVGGLQAPMQTPGLAGGQVAPAQIGTVNTTAGTGANPWLALSQAIGGFQGQREQQRNDKEDRAYLLEQRSAAKQNAEMTVANNQIEMLKPRLLSSPQLASDPATIEAFKAVYAKLGMPAPIKADGTIDVDQFKPSWETVAPTEQKFIAELPPEQRKPFLDKYGGVPKEMFTTSAFISAKDQSAILRNTLKSSTDAERTKISQERTQIAGEREKAYADGNYARIGEIERLGNEADAKTAEIRERTREMPALLTDKLNRTQGYLKHLESMPKGSAGSLGVMRLMRSSADDLIRQHDTSVSEFARLSAEYQTVLANTRDPDSPEITAVRDQMNAAQDAITASAAGYQRATDYINGAGATFATGGQVQSSGGGHVKDVQPVGGGASIGDAPQGMKPGKYNYKGEKVEIRGDGKIYKLNG